MKSKLNCWEYFNCKSEDKNKCPAFNYGGEGKHTNSGKCGGRVCWMITGTMCGGKVQGNCEDKVDRCTKCDFFKLVEKEQGFLFQSLLDSVQDEKIDSFTKDVTFHIHRGFKLKNIAILESDFVKFLDIHGRGINLTINFANCCCVDMSALTLLLSFHKTLNVKKTLRNIKLVNCSTHLKEMIKRLNFDKIFKI